MIKSKKFWPRRGNLIPVYDLPGEYFINLREPWKEGDPGTPDTFSCGLQKENHQAVYAIIKAIVDKHGGSITEKINVYNGLYVKNMTEEAMEEICQSDYVHNIGTNVSILPQKSHAFYNRTSDKKPESYERDVMTAALHLANHGVLVERPEMTPREQVMFAIERARGKKGIGG